MTERIRWYEGDGPFVAMIGCVGTLDDSVFSILRPGSESDEWALTGRFPGDARFGGSLEELKAEAERWLEEHVAALGAVFPAETAGVRAAVAEALNEAWPHLPCDGMQDEVAKVALEAAGATGEADQ